MSRHRKPNLSRISMRLDIRGAQIAKPVSATQNGKVIYWLRISRLGGGSRFDVPLLSHWRHQSRSGELAGSVQINCNRAGELTFGVVTDIGAACAAARASYQGKGEIAFDSASPPCSARARASCSARTGSSACVSLTRPSR